MASLIKAWFRELPTPLLAGVGSAALRDNEEAISSAMGASLRKRAPALHIFQWLLDLMADVVDQLEYTRMSAKAMAAVIAPSLMDMVQLEERAESVEKTFQGGGGGFKGGVGGGGWVKITYLLIHSCSCV